MRHASRVVLAALAASVLVSAPAKAEHGWDDFVECVNAAHDWAKEAKQDAKWYEKMGIDIIATAMMIGCYGEFLH
jgi:hypothetical protein